MTSDHDVKALADRMITAVKSHVALALDDRIGKLDARIAELEARVHELEQHSSS